MGVYMGFNAKHFEVVTNKTDRYTREYIEGILKDMPCKYSFILHDKDTDETGKAKTPHWHIYVNFGTTTWNSENVAKRFGVAENFVCKVKGRSGDILAYLTHQNAPEKYQYNECEVISNYDWRADKEKTLSKKGKEIRASEIRELIVCGTIREYNQTQYITAEEYYTHKRVIESAYEYRKQLIKGVERDMKAIYIYGDSASGKTTLAKDIAKEKGYSVYVSSGSNDVLDDYKGEDCIILDDLRPSCLGLSDLLKMLDNNTSSSVKSRFKNKVLECRMIIITTTKPIQTFFREVYDSETETSVQLMRRCQVLVHLTMEYMQQFVWNGKAREYMSTPKVPNPVISRYKPKDMTQDEALEFLADTLGSYGAMVKDVLEKRKAGEYPSLDDGEWEQLDLSDELPFE